MDSLSENQRMIVNAIIILVVIYVLYLAFFAGKESKFMPFDAYGDINRARATPSYIYAMNPYGTLDDPLTTSANEGINYSQLKTHDLGKFVGTDQYNLKYLNNTKDTQNITDEGIYYDIYGGILPPVDIIDTITSTTDITPNTSAAPAPAIVAATPMQAVVMPAAATPSAATGATAIPVGSSAPTTSIATSAVSTPSGPPVSANTASRFTYF